MEFNTPADRTVRGDRSKAQNAPMESFFSSLKNEPVDRTRFRSRQEARAALFEYIAIFYNRRRRHSSIGCRTPEQARMAA
ncbi:IS3 family transposase [Rhodovulum sp. YEN HP10]|uniref:IS3 family transposase n=1 Tax=Rhodovulum sp. HP10 TaxID=3387397 RepID=UPI0039E1374A